MSNSTESTSYLLGYKSVEHHDVILKERKQGLCIANHEDRRHSAQMGWCEGLWSRVHLLQDCVREAISAWHLVGRLKIASNQHRQHRSSTVHIFYTYINEHRTCTVPFQSSVPRSSLDNGTPLCTRILKVVRC